MDDIRRGEISVSYTHLMLNDDGEIRDSGFWMTSDGERYSISHEGGRRTGVSSLQTDPQSWSVMTRTTNTPE